MDTTATATRDQARVAITDLARRVGILLPQVPAPAYGWVVARDRYDLAPEDLETAGRELVPDLRAWRPMEAVAHALGLLNGLPDTLRHIDAVRPDTDHVGRIAAQDGEQPTDDNPLILVALHNERGRLLDEALPPGVQDLLRHGTLRMDGKEGPGGYPTVVAGGWLPTRNGLRAAAARLYEAAVNYTNPRPDGAATALWDARTGLDKLTPRETPQ